MKVTKKILIGIGIPAYDEKKPFYWFDGPGAMAHGAPTTQESLHK